MRRSYLASKHPKGVLFGFGIFALIVFIFSTGFLIKTLLYYDKTDAVVEKKEYISGGRGGTYIMSFSYSYNDEEYCHYIDVYTTAFYSEGSSAVIFINPEGGDIKVLSDMLMMPIAALILLIASIFGIIKLGNKPTENEGGLLEWISRNQ